MNILQIITWKRVQIIQIVPDESTTLLTNPGDTHDNTTTPYRLLLYVARKYAQAIQIL